MQLSTVIHSSTAYNLKQLAELQLLIISRDFSFRSKVL